MAIILESWVKTTRPYQQISKDITNLYLRHAEAERVAARAIESRNQVVVEMGRLHQELNKAHEDLHGERDQAQANLLRMQLEIDNMRVLMRMAGITPK